MKLTPALEKIFEQRASMNQGRACMTGKLNSCQVFLYTNYMDEPCAIGYQGRATNPSFDYRYSSKEKRFESIKSFIESCNKKETEKPSRKLASHDLQVGDVLVSSWGYDQTNVDYYLVQKRIGKSMVQIVEIGAKTVSDDTFYSSHVLPNPSRIIGEPMKKRVTNGRVRITSCQGAYKKADLTKPDYCSWGH